MLNTNAALAATKRKLEGEIQVCQVVHLFLNFWVVNALQQLQSDMEEALGELKNADDRARKVSPHI